MYICTAERLYTVHCTQQKKLHNHRWILAFISASRPRILALKIAFCVWLCVLGVCGLGDGVCVLGVCVLRLSVCVCVCVCMGIWSQGCLRECKCS